VIGGSEKWEEERGKRKEESGKWKVESGKWKEKRGIEFITRFSILITLNSLL
jgi:hypothetical protein